MRIIPKKIKVKNTVWKCYSMVDVIVALFIFAVIFIAVTSGQWAIAAILGLVAIGMFMPTPDGIFYTCVFENVKFLLSKKKYTAKSKSAKENVDVLIDLREIKDSGLLAFKGGLYGRVIKIGQKNFGIEDVVQQNIDINYFANALKFVRAMFCQTILHRFHPVTTSRSKPDSGDRNADVPPGSGWQYCLLKQDLRLPLFY